MKTLNKLLTLTSSLLEWAPDWLRPCPRCCCCRHAAVGTESDRERHSGTNTWLHHAAPLYTCWNPATDTSSKFTTAYVDANCGSSCCIFLVLLEDFYAHIWCRVVRSRDFRAPIQLPSATKDLRVHKMPFPIFSELNSIHTLFLVNLAVVCINWATLKILDWLINCTIQI